MRWPERAAVPALLFAAALIGVPGSVDLPLEAHEAFVVQTTREMAARGDWILPWFNGAPRLNKPPMNYWLTGAAAAVTGPAAQAEPLDARAVSFAAGLGLLAIAWFCGLWQFDRATALLAGLLLITSRGFFMFTHDGRPDMLYAFFCGAAICAFVRARRPHGGAPAVYAMWLCYALATLTKGPQMPAAFLAATLIFSRHALGSWREALGLHRVPAGLALLLLVTVPWWLAVQRHLGGHGLEGSQLSGSLLRPHPSQFFNFFYFYQTLMLLLPWLPLVPLAVLAALRARGAQREESILLALLVAIPTLMLSLGPQQRVIYMLPCLVPLCLLLARGALFLDSVELGRRRTAVALGFVLLQGAIPLAVMATLMQRRMQWPAEPVFAATTLLLLLALAWVAREGPRMHAGRLALVCAALLTAGYLGSGLTLSAWNVERFDLRRLAYVARDAAGPAPIVAWQVEPDAFTYYTGRSISVAGSQGELRKMLEAAPDRRLILITQRQMLARAAALAPAAQLGSEQRASPRALVVARLGPAAP